MKLPDEMKHNNNSHLNDRRTRNLVEASLQNGLQFIAEQIMNS